MLESLIFVFIVISVGVSLILAFIFILIGFVKKSRKLKIVALQCGIIAVFFYALIPMWYKVITPWSNQSTMNEFSGVYILDHSDSTTEAPTLVLNSNGTYVFKTSEKLVDLELEKRGKWKTGGIDGTLEFFNNKGQLLERASNFGSGENTRISFYIFNRNNNQFMFMRKKESRSSIK